jgi:hypothetical protein
MHKVGDGARASSQKSDFGASENPLCSEAFRELGTMGGSRDQMIDESRFNDVELNRMDDLASLASLARTGGIETSPILT